MNWLANRMDHDVAIVGVGTTVQGLHGNVSPYRLAVEALKDALVDSGLVKDSINGVLTGRLAQDRIPVDSVRLSQLIGLTPRVTGYLDYNSGGFTTQYAAMLISAGICDIVACVYARNLRTTGYEYSGEHAYNTRLGFYNNAAVSALGWQAHMDRYGTTEAALGHVVVSAREYGALNPIAAWRSPITMDDYFSDERVVGPFRSLDICKVTAGGVALILARADIAKTLPKPPVYFVASGRQEAPGKLDNPDHLLCYGMRDSAAQVYGSSGVQQKDIDVLFISDASSAAVLHTLENYGFCDEGGSEAFVSSGAISMGGSLPVNPHGGQLSEGYLVGWLHHAEMVRQLRGEAEDRQVEGARIAQYCTTGAFREHFLSSIYQRDT